MIPLALATGCALLTYGLFGLWRATASRRWPTAGAVIIDASLDQGVVVSRFRHPVYFPRIRFQYSWAGRTLTSEKLTTRAVDHQYSDRKRAEKIVAAYAPGTPTIARVNPKNPTHAVLFSTESSKALQDYIAWSILGVLVLVVTLFVAFHDAA